MAYVFLFFRLSHAVLTTLRNRKAVKRDGVCGRGMALLWLSTSLNVTGTGTVTVTDCHSYPVFRGDGPRRPLMGVVEDGGYWTRLVCT